MTPKHAVLPITRTPGFRGLCYGFCYGSQAITESVMGLVMAPLNCRLARQVSHNTSCYGSVITALPGSEGCAHNSHNTPYKGVMALWPPRPHHGTGRMGHLDSDLQRPEHDRREANR